MSVNYKMVGRQIKVRRCTRRMSQAFLAEQVELSVSYISCIERAKKQVSLEALVRIANSLDTTVDSLLIGSQTNDPFSLTARWAELLSDCSNEEKILIYDTAFALKASLRHRFFKLLLQKTTI